MNISRSFPRRKEPPALRDSIGARGHSARSFSVSVLQISPYSSFFKQAETQPALRAIQPYASENSLKQLVRRWPRRNFTRLEPLEPLQPGLEDAMDIEDTPQEKKPIADQMTEIVAQAAGTLAETAVRAVAKRAKKAVGKRASTKRRAGSVSKAGKKAPKRRAKKAAAKKRTAKKTSKGQARKTSKKSKR